MSIYTRTDVTAVKFYDKWVLAGIGSYFNVFDSKLFNLTQRLKALNGQKVYGFVPSKNGKKILVFGGKQFTVFEVSKNRYEKLFDSVYCNDWLHSAIWISSDKVAVLSAHNVLQIWDVTNQVMLSEDKSKDNSILYSGLILSIEDNILVFAGTVFSEVIIHRPCDDKPLLKLEGHKGVIFSISCSLDKETIVTTSDDRSVRIWRTKSELQLLPVSIEYWKKSSVICSHEVYGHSARVMRSCMTSNNIISVGEDATICFWDYNGQLLSKKVSHHNGSIWCVDANDQHLVTGGGDCGIILHPLTVAVYNGENKNINFGSMTLKKIVFTARKNMVILTEGNKLIYYDVEAEIDYDFQLDHQSTYKMLSTSPCKQLVAVLDMCGNLAIFMENCKGDPHLSHVIQDKLNIGKILSMQWAGFKYLVCCSENGIITIVSSIMLSTEVITTLSLPPCRERWLTASAVDFTQQIIVVGDRCGNIHFYVNGRTIPVKSFNKVHGRYGPTSITIKKHHVVTTGRDGSIKYFLISITDIGIVIKYMSSKEVEFNWIEKFLDRDENLVCGFQERDFVVYDCKSNAKLLQISCGGGHRSWDAVRYKGFIFDEIDEFIELIYIKDSYVHMCKFQLSKIVARNIVSGSHSKEINCLKSIRLKFDYKFDFFLTGGEDTTLRICSLNSDLVFQDLCIFKQLSNIRTLKIMKLNNNRYLLLSAGGRAQICGKIIDFCHENDSVRPKCQELFSYQIKGTDRERKGNQNWRNCSIDFDPETRIMDLDILKHNDDYFVFTGCSDAILRVFKLEIEGNKFEIVKESKHHTTCILKTQLTNIAGKDVLITCTTRGEVTFWKIHMTLEIVPITTMFTNKSGINGISTMIIENYLLVATGGDDNAVHLNLVTCDNNMTSMKIASEWIGEQYHSSQITGVNLVTNHLITASIDQRVTLFNLEIHEGKIDCVFNSQTYSDVADIQGIDVIESNMENIIVCVFGKGLELIKLKI